jgi:hypothetical protein
MHKKNCGLCSGKLFKIWHVQPIPQSLRSRGAPPAQKFFFFFFLRHIFSGPYRSVWNTAPQSQKLSFLFLGLEGWDQHHCNPLAKLLLVRVTRVLQLAPTGNCGACVGSRSTPSACTYCRTGCVAQLFSKKLGPGVPPDSASFVGLAVSALT